MLKEIRIYGQPAANLLLKLNSSYINISLLKENIFMIVPINYRNVMPGRYLITDNARVFEIDNKRNTVTDITDRASYLDKSIGYYCIYLYDKTNHKNNYLLHRLVIGSFMGDEPNLVVDHLNMNKTDNRLSNLEYVTSRENLRRAAVAYGKDYELMSEDLVRNICELLEKGYHATKIMKELSLPNNAAMMTSIVAIYMRQRWTDISKDYNWDVDDIRLKIYSKEDLKLIAYMIYYSGYGPKEIAERFPKYDLKKLNQVVKKMNQGKLYKKFLEEAGSTTIGKGKPPRDSDGFMRLIPTPLGVKQLRKIRQDLNRS
jgi:hypothetical protein